MSAPALLGVAAAALALALPVVGASAALEAGARARGAADAAALAAADALNGYLEAEPCAVATRVANAVSATLESCELQSEEGGATVRVSVTSVFGSVSRVAHAAPPYI